MIHEIGFDENHIQLLREFPQKWRTLVLRT